mgnify:CR=1 FL=1
MNFVSNHIDEETKNPSLINDDRSADNQHLLSLIQSIHEMMRTQTTEKYILRQSIRSTFEKHTWYLSPLMESIRYETTE